MEPILIILFAFSFAGFIFCGVLLYRVMTNKSNSKKKRHYSVYKKAYFDNVIDG